MFNPIRARKAFLKLTHEQKMSKVKEIVTMLKDKSDFFLGMYNMFDTIPDIDDAILVYIYGVTMQLVAGNQYKEQVSIQQQIKKKKAKIQHIKELENQEKEDVESLLRGE